MRKALQAAAPRRTHPCTRRRPSPLCRAPTAPSSQRVTRSTAFIPNHPSPPTCPCSSGAVFNLHIHSGHTQAPRPHTKPLHRNPCHPERLPRARLEHPTAHNCWTPPGEPAAPKSRTFKIKLIFNSPANCVRSFGHSVIDLNSHPSPTPQEGLRHPKSSSAASSASRAWPSWIPPCSLLPSPLPLFSLRLHSLCHLSSLVLTNSHAGCAIPSPFKSLC